MHLTLLNHQSITFYRTEAAARAVTARGEMTEADGYFVVPAEGRPGCFVIEVRDPEADYCQVFYL